MKYLIKTTEIYRVDSEHEVEEMLTEAKNDSQYELTKYSSQHKEIKSKGEVIDEYELVSLTKSFTAEKEPDRQINISYDGGAY